MPYQLLPTKLYARHLHKQQHGDGEEKTQLWQVLKILL